jgi:nucleotide-binding universal stress UspA family protein
MLPYTIRKIIVPIDLSETSLNALDTAVAIAKRHQAELILLNVIESDLDFLGEGNGFSSFNNLSHSSDVLTALAGGIQHTHALSPRVIQEEGHVSYVILKTALLHQADLIVIGTHGASGYRDGFIGSNAYSVIKHATCPVLTIPPKKKYLSFRRAMFPIRPVTGALQRFDVVSSVLSPNAHLDVVGMSYRRMERETSVLDKILDEISLQLQQDNIIGRTSWGNGDAISQDVLEYIHTHLPDLVVLTSVLDVTTKPNFVGPHAQKIMHGSKVPVLSIKRIAVPKLVS